MVKNILNSFMLTLIFCVFSGCNVDLLGLFVSSDLDERLKDKDNLKLINDKGWTELSLGDEYSFIVVSDTHIEDGNAKGFDRLAGVIQADPSIKFIIVLGDITQYGSAKDIDTFLKAADSFGIPYYPVIGNHDVYFGNWSVWREKIGSTSYRINGGNTTLFILDSANSFFGKEQLNWLEREMQTANNRVFVFTHSPLFVKGPVDMQQITDTKERARIVSILRNKCDIMFMGHLHKRIITETGNVRYISIEDFVDAKAYCVVTVSAGGVDYKFEIAK